jgi:hypothetical protein
VTDSEVMACETAGELREQPGGDQMRLMRVIYEPFDQTGEWPWWQYVDLTLDAQFGIDAAAVLNSLPAVGQTGAASLSYGLIWRGDSHMQPQPGTPVTLTVAGVRHLPEADPLLATFLTIVRFLVDEQRKLRPAPCKVVEATVTSEAIEQQILTASINGSAAPPVKATMRKVRELLGHEPFLHGIVHQPQHGVEQWTVRVPAVLREYRDVASVDDYVSIVTTLVAPAEALPAPSSAGPLDIPNAIGYLGAVWKSKTGSRLFADLDPASTARLTQPCGTEEEFNSLMSALADVLGQAVTPGKTVAPQRGALEAVRDYLVPKLDAAAAERVTNAIETLIRLRRIRVSTQHSDARHKAVAAFSEIGLPFPPVSWDWAWNHIAAAAKGALDVMREEIHAGLSES